ncbi:aminoglycoside phosphotransferase family protein [Halalkalibacterium halodurans]|uniref:Aminoglycoside phosphotransferase domain-containing protein n=1 Tax=Halalkalibacterium halodurans TaxID=86665 RepID=A0A0M0KJN8_ALKHA|nr:aminoglycoside phosphotransferase family protein [Halalkalibacterium halodurans]TPE67910.1 aminoglycoside phosphotransferase family protein [Halalkalibacterium halodurans]
MNEQIIEDLSSPWSGNTVHLVTVDGNQLIKKQYRKKEGYLREVHALRTVPQTICPSLVDAYEQQQTIYTTYEPLQKDIQAADLDEIIGSLLRQLHQHTAQKTSVFDPGNGVTKETWLDYLESFAPNWLQTIGTDKYESMYCSTINSVRAAYNKKQRALCLIHRDARLANVGQGRNGHFLFLDFELAIIGDPLWDVARYLIQSVHSETTFLKAYEFDHTEIEVLQAYKKLYAMSFMNYLIKNKQADTLDFKKCVNVLTN